MQPFQIMKWLFLCTKIQNNLKKKTNATTKSAKVQPIGEEAITYVNLEGKVQTGFHLSKSAKPIISSFKKDFEDDHKAKTTIKSYMFDVFSFIEFVESGGTSFKGTFKRTQYTNYIKEQQEQNMKANTVNKRINSMQSFNRFLVQQKLMVELIVNLKMIKCLLASISSTLNI